MRPGGEGTNDTIYRVTVSHIPLPSSLLPTALLVGEQELEVGSREVNLPLLR